ncbi:hypothetical protein V0Q12_06835 [Limosilactobacillus reuteri]|uniref:hypothetical protein n=1 Tax=Limosilactobacillus reuteri TaxID=1598 RepID=UPI002E7C1ECA|nr:hypothetical protein [Limosilactobacillus reuteri]MEE1989274.1 hypothetical protein [Limosilactobacillus reuteri]
MRKIFKFLTKFNYYSKKLTDFMVCIFCLICFTYLALHITYAANPDAVIFEFQKLRIFDCLITILFLTGFFSFPLFILGWLTETLGFQISEKYLDDLSKIAIILSTITGLLITQTKEQFEFTATFISFVLIFMAFFPKEIFNLPSDVIQKLIQKRHYNTDKKQQKK